MSAEHDTRLAPKYLMLSTGDMACSVLRVMHTFCTERKRVHRPGALPAGLLYISFLILRCTTAYICAEHAGVWPVLSQQSCHFLCTRKASALVWWPEDLFNDLLTI